MIITVDLGNSAIKIGYFENGVLKRKEVFDVEKAGEIEFHGPAEGAIFSSVVPEKEEMLRKKLLKLTDRVIKLSHTNARIKIQYRNPAQLGADRISHAYFVKSFVKRAAIVVDIGTALTVDAILGDGTFLGGAIHASPQTILDALSMKTSKLKRIKLDTWPDSFLGKSTEECLKVGILYGVIGTVLHIVKNIEVETGRNFEKYLTGGGGKFFEEKLENFHYNPDLNLYGLLAAFEEIKMER